MSGRRQSREDDLFYGEGPIPDDDPHGEDFYEDDDHGDDGSPWPAVGSTGAPNYRRTPRRSLPRRRLGRHPVLVSFAALLLIIVAAVGGGLWWISDQINPGGHPGPDVAVTIPSGASVKTIGSILASKGVIHQGTVFAYYVHLHNDGPLLPGSYHLPRNSSYQSIISDLESGPKILTDTLVIPEGFTVRQIADTVGALPGLGLSASKFLADATDGAVRSPYEPTGVNNLEGLLFPATYQVRQGETEADVIGQMVAAFDDRAATLGLNAAAAKLGYTPYQVVTVASIVEKEAKLPADRANVASALYNRLRIGMPLGADSTQTYYLRLTDPSLGVATAAQDDTPSPYNTRLNKGLPPTPISNPGLASLTAATNPNQTTYLYFVETNPDGQLSFASTESGFSQLEEQCRAVNLC